MFGTRSVGTVLPYLLYLIFAINFLRIAPLTEWTLFILGPVVVQILLLAHHRQILHQIYNFQEVEVAGHVPFRIRGPFPLMLREALFIRFLQFMVRFSQVFDLLYSLFLKSAISLLQMTILRIQGLEEFIAEIRDIFEEIMAVYQAAQARFLNMRRIQVRNEAVPAG